MSHPYNYFDALVLAFKLALTARTAQQIERIQSEVPDFIANVAPEDVSLAREQALEELKAMVDAYGLWYTIEGESRETGAKG